MLLGVTNYLMNSLKADIHPSNAQKLCPYLTETTASALHRPRD
jgi:hypothetical protein